MFLVFLDVWEMFKCELGIFVLISCGFWSFGKMVGFIFFYFILVLYYDIDISFIIREVIFVYIIKVVILSKFFCIREFFEYLLFFFKYKFIVIFFGIIEYNFK